MKPIDVAVLWEIAYSGKINLSIETALLRPKSAAVGKASEPTYNRNDGGRVSAATRKSNDMFAVVTMYLKWNVFAL